MSIPFGGDLIPMPVTATSYSWSCETCGYTGVVNLLTTAAGLAVYQRIAMAHDEASPACPDRKIRSEP